MTIMTVTVVEPTPYQSFMEVKLLLVLVYMPVWHLFVLVDHHQGRGELQAWRIHQDRAGARNIQTQPQRGQWSPGSRPDREGKDCFINLFYTAWPKKKCCHLDLTKQIGKASYGKITALAIIFLLAKSYLTPTDAMSGFPFLEQPFRKTNPVFVEKMVVCLGRVKSLACIKQRKRIMDSQLAIFIFFLFCLVSPSTICLYKARKLYAHAPSLPFLLLILVNCVPPICWNKNYSVLSGVQSIHLDANILERMPRKTGGGGVFWYMWTWP